ncbi:MAG: CCA tRNA nucleotidyltransferase [Planctomycetes bacterium]|nr:CCA tRNA nucleotidyltransferase [Planctomycetota bacterium]NUQ34778.1 CCA tRNA nucleotidyltransferase [Planctomycetaceae bacterium]
MAVTAAHALALSIVRRLRDAGHVAYFAGGCVRDRILGGDPKDYDVATSAQPDTVEKLFTRSVPVGKAFGVIRVLDETNSAVAVEVATFRSDGRYLDGRRPESVTYSGEVEDAKRRDFTINGLFYDPLVDKVIDHIGGADDIRARIVRAIGEPHARFSEDKLRLLRAVRFACRFNFEIEEATWKALCEMAGQITQVSYERIRDELNATFTGMARGRALRLLLESGLLDAVLPEVAALVGKPGPAGDLFGETAAMLDMLDKESVTQNLAWGALLHAACQPNEADALLRRLKQSNVLIERVTTLLRLQDTPASASQMSLAELKRYLRTDGIDEVLTLHALIQTARGGGLDGARFCRRKLTEYAATAKGDPLRPVVPIDGNDLKALGIPPGPFYKEVIEAIETEMLEDRLYTKNEAIVFAQERWKR